VTSRTCRRHHRPPTGTTGNASATTGSRVGGGDGRTLPPPVPVGCEPTCAQEVYIITLPVDGIQLQSLILTGTGVGTEATTLGYSPASSSDGAETKTSSWDDVKTSWSDVKPDVTDDGNTAADVVAGSGVGQRAPCSGLDTLAAVADRLRQEMLDEEAAEHGGETDPNAKLDGTRRASACIVVRPHGSTS